MTQYKGIKRLNLSLSAPNPPPVLTKADFVRRYEQGEFGNRAPTWKTLDDFTSSGYVGLVHIRNRVAGGPTWYNVCAASVVSESNRLVREGLVKLESLYWSGMAPTHLTLIQGEILECVGGLSLYYSRIRKPMRDSLREGGRQITGLSAKVLLDYYLDSPSLEWLECLLKAYPEHVIEFSTYSRCWGTVPKRNTVIWEVRNY